MDEVPASVATEWPVGPAYTEWVGANGVGAWVAYKLGAAEWFIDQLERVGDLVGYYRYVGVEMALDGALAALCGGFDAAVGGLIGAVDKYFDSAPDGSPDVARESIPPHRYSWRRCRERLELLRTEDLNLDVEPLIQEIEQALEAPDDGPLGWLVECQRLRNAAIHQDTLARHIEVASHNVVGAVEQIGASQGGNATWSITVQGRGEHPVEYLRGVERQLEALTKRMVAVIDWLCPSGVPTVRRRANG